MRVCEPAYGCYKIKKRRKTERQAVLKKWVQEGIDVPQVMDAARVHDRMRKVIASAANAPTVEVTVAGAE